MESSTPRRILIVANLTASTPQLLQEVERRANEQPTQFTLLIPDAASRKSSDWTLGTAVRLLEKAAGGRVEGNLGGADAFDSVQKALSETKYDDVIISTLPRRTSEWLRRDLPRRIEKLGVPVSVITMSDEQSPLKAFAEQFSAR